jgi:hypothetical protein
MNNTHTEQQSTNAPKSTKTTKPDARIAPLVEAYGELMDLRKEADTGARKASITRQLRRIVTALDGLGYDTSMLEPIPGKRAATTALPVSTKTAATLAMLAQLESDAA